MSGFGSGYNLPPGCYESDLPGYNDPDPPLVEHECRDCDAVWNGEAVVVWVAEDDFDVRDHEPCIECGSLFVTVYP